MIRTGFIIAFFHDHDTEGNPLTPFNYTLSWRGMCVRFGRHYYGYLFKSL